MQLRSRNGPGRDRAEIEQQNTAAGKPERPVIDDRELEPLFRLS